MVGRALVILVALILALPVAAVPPADAKKKFKTKTVTETFANAGTITIPDEGNASPSPSTISVGGFKKGQVTKIALSLEDFSHTFPNDVGVSLVAPNGRTALILNGAGGDFDVTNIDLTFDDDAAAALPDDAQIVGGTFRASVFDLPSGTNAPYRSLDAFAGADPNGIWQLFVFDESSPDQGQIAGGWSLEITAKVKVKKKKK
jgi:subtilisin-like proprotein convertase family protein